MQSFPIYHLIIDFYYEWSFFSLMHDIYKPTIKTHPSSSFFFFFSFSFLIYVCCCWCYMTHIIIPPPSYDLNSLFQSQITTTTVPAHYMEYSCQITITLVNFIFIWSQVRSSKNAMQQARNDEDIEAQSKSAALLPKEEQSGQSNNNTNTDKNNSAANTNSSSLDSSVSIFYKYRYIEFGVAIAVFLASIIQLLVYSKAIPVKIESERAAHFVEFSVEAANGAFASFFAIVTYMAYNKIIERHADQVTGKYARMAIYY